MPTTAPLPQGSSSHGLPRRHGTLGHTSLVAVMQAEGAAEDHEVTGYGLENPGGEGQLFQDDMDEDEMEEEDEDDMDDEEDDEDGESEEGSLHYAAQNSCPHHYPHHPPPLAGQPSYFHDPDAYFSDSQDMSDGAAVPPVNYAVAHLLSDDIDMDAPAASDSDVDFSWVQNIGTTSHPLIPLDPDIVANTEAAQAAAMDTDIDAEDGGSFAGLMIAPELGSFFGQPVTGGAWTHPFSITSSNNNAIGPSNYSLTEFLHHWARQSRVLQGVTRGTCPWPEKIDSLKSQPIESIEYDELEGDQYDIQGVDWEGVGVTREDARERRLLTYTNYVNMQGSDRWTPDLPDAVLPRRESFFRFRRMDIQRDINLSHFQLRHVFASTSRSRVFYPSIGTIQQFNPLSGDSRTVMEFSDAPSSQVSTMDAGLGVLVAGGFGGEYMLRSLDSDEPDETACHSGIITDSASGITNHVAVQQTRTSSAPLAAFASNDNCFRLLDVTTEKWLSQEILDFAPNCTAVSPDGRMRVVVGDSLDVLITAADSRFASFGEAEILQRLTGHRDYGFACAWADDGWTIATGFQDKTVQIWDARRFTDNTGSAAPLCTLRSEMAGTRSLHFSPVGSGKRVLVAAEEADFINIIDAQTFRSRQTIDVFGELGGVSFVNGGRDLMALCCDPTRGGILQLERCGEGREFLWTSDGDGFSHGGRHQRRKSHTFDWPRSMFTQETRIKGSWWRRGAAAHVEIDPF